MRHNRHHPFAPFLVGSLLLLAAMSTPGCTNAPQPAQDLEPPIAAESPAAAVHTALAARTAHLADVTAPGWTPKDLDEVLAWLDARDEWQDHGRPLAVPRHPAEKYLTGYCIVLDPGHGGKADVPGYKRGPTGVREAEMNLRVARLLRKLLTDAGAFVVLTRDGETSAAADDRLEDTLQRRADVANNLARPDGGTGADLFLSLHHNAIGKPEVNYATVWFHGEVDEAEPSLDPARHVGHRLGAELRCAGTGLTGILMNDRQMYKTGFGVLRAARVPAFLTESSFFTHPEEEQRLRDAAYNLREAYAIYLGLVEYAYGGRPTQSTPELHRDGDELVLTTKLSEGLPAWWGSDRPRILSSTIAVYVQGERVPAAFDPATKMLTARLPASAGAAGSVEVAIHHANLYKHHNWPQRYRVPHPLPPPPLPPVLPAGT
jgi:N-acetylmuramoyl-L-alanine amidase